MLFVFQVLVKDWLSNGGLLQILVRLRNSLFNVAEGPKGVVENELVRLPYTKKIERICGRTLHRASQFLRLQLSETKLTDCHVPTIQFPSVKQMMLPLQDYLLRKIARWSNNKVSYFSIFFCSKCY